MNNNQNKNLCYVFSPKTAETALAQWSAEQIKENPKSEEGLAILAVALPLFLAHINADASIYMFSKEDLNEAIKEWKVLQIEGYPHQEKRINETCDLIVSFLVSEVVLEHKMCIEA